MATPEDNSNAVQRPNMVIPCGKVTLSIAAPPDAETDVLSPVSSGYNCVVYATNPVDPLSNTESSINCIAMKTPIFAVTASVFANTDPA